VVLFAKFFSWHELSKSFITLHENSSHDHLFFHAHFGGKMTNLKLVHCMDKIPLPTCAWGDFKWIWAPIWYCSRMHLHGTSNFPILVTHPIFTNLN
jgi:hypothetical protein